MATLNDLLSKAAFNFDQLSLDERLLVSLADAVDPIDAMTNAQRAEFAAYVDEEFALLTFEQRLLASLLQLLKTRSQGAQPVNVNFSGPGEFFVATGFGTSNWRATAYDLDGYPDPTVVIAKVKTGNTFSATQARVIVSDPAGFTGTLQFSL